MNEHITQYLDYYLNLPKTPNYAIMLRGKWGSGKSWYIKNYMQHKGTDQFLYVSLYGLTSFKEIEDAFFQQIHPVLASKGMKLAGKIIKGLVKATIKVDLDGDGKEEGSVNPNIPDINLPDYLKNIDSKIIVFDDLERCAIETSNILGYINQLVEYNDAKVIVIANEDEIIKASSPNNTNNSKSYLSIKEKLFGKSFDITSDFKSAITEFRENLQSEELKDLVLNNENLIKEIFEIANYNNLRHLKQSLLDFERFYNFFPQSAKDKTDLLEHILKLFFSISFELKKGIITEDQIKNIFQLDYFRNEKAEKTETQKIREKYPIFGFYNHPIDTSLWLGYFKTGTVNVNDFKTSIENSSYFQKENTPDWIKLWYAYDADDDEFEELFKKVNSSFENLEIENKYELVQITCMLLNYSNKKLIPSSKRSILSTADKNIANLKEKKYLNLNKHEEFPSQSSHGLEYQGLSLLEVQKFLKKITSESTNSQFENYPELATDLLVMLSTSIYNFGERITLSNSRENLYYDVPILKFIDSKEFVKKFLELPNKNKRQLGTIIERRYKFKDFNSKLIEELEWLETIKNLLKVEASNLKGKISGDIIQHGFLISIEKAITSLKE